MSMSRGRLAGSILLLLNVVLVLTIWLIWRTPSHSGAAIDESSELAAPLQLPQNPLRTLSLEHYRELIARPLFWSERRALQSELPAEVSTGNQPLAFVLMGVVTSPQSKSALLSKPGSSDVFKVQPGDVVEGWQVESLTANSVNLSSGGEHQQITLDEERTKPR